MKALTLVLPFVILGGCERSPDRIETEQSPPAATVEQEQVKTSIMRPEAVLPTPEVKPMQPLKLIVRFAEGGASLTPSESDKLAAIIDSPQVEAGAPIRLAAHSDSAGSDTANLAASRQRGEAVRNWLVEHGIAKDRITLVAFGEQNPIRPNALPDGAPNVDGRSANRRVEILVPVASPAPAASREPTLAEEIVEGSAEGTTRPAPPDNSD